MISTTSQLILAALLSLNTSAFAKPPVNNGIEIDDSVFPSVVRLGIHVSKNGEGMCTGTAIAPNAILAAAHCFLDISDSKLIEKLNAFTFPGNFALVSDKNFSDDLQINGKSVKSQLSGVILPYTYVYNINKERLAIDRIIKQENNLATPYAPFSAEYRLIRKRAEDRAGELNQAFMEKNIEHDLAILVFKKDLFTATNKISLDAPTAGASVAMVGYGRNTLGGDTYTALMKETAALEQQWKEKKINTYYYLDTYDQLKSKLELAQAEANQTGGIKRWGRNTINSCPSNVIDVLGLQDTMEEATHISIFGWNMYTINAETSGRIVGVSPGDSGGPLFLIQKEGSEVPSEFVQIGVASQVALVTDSDEHLVEGIVRSKYVPLYTEASKSFITTIRDRVKLKIETVNLN